MHGPPDVTIPEGSRIPERELIARAIRVLAAQIHENGCAIAISTGAARNPDVMVDVDLDAELKFREEWRKKNAT